MSVGRGAFATNKGIERRDWKGISPGMALEIAPSSHNKSWRRNAVPAAVLTAPALVVVALLLMVPIAQAIYYSMTDWDGLTTHWEGPSTYVHLFRDPRFLQVLGNNAVLLLAVPVTIILALAIAAVLHERIWGWKLLRTMIFTPTILSWVVIGIVATNVFAVRGPINNVLRISGLGGFQTQFLGGEHSALIAVAITFIWAMVGPNMMILFSGLSAVEPAIYEAARLDGASWLKTFRYITLPLMNRYLQFCFVFTLIMAFTGLFSLVFVMTGGGPGYSTTTLEFFIYRQAFNIGAFGQAALLGIVLLVIIFLVSIIQMRLTREDRR
jgi:multiple sugar transport system permease protein